MERRRILSYTGLLIAGIYVGDLFWEERRMPEAMLLLLSIAFVCLEIHLHFREITGIEKNQLFAMLCFLLLGVGVMSWNYRQMTVPELEKESGEVQEITGRIYKTVRYDDRYTYYVEAEYSGKGRRILCNQYLDEDTSEKKGSMAENSESLYETGTYVRVYGTLRLPATRRNPTCFDYRKYLKSQGICYTMTVQGMKRLGTSKRFPYPLHRRLIEWRDRFLGHFDSDTEVQNFLLGSVFGCRTGIDEETYREFTENGTAHILAVSGLHVGFLVSLITVIMQKRKQRAVSAGIFTILLLYGEMTEWSPSTVRAVMIAGLSMAAPHLNRAFDLSAAVSASAAVVLVIHPYHLFQAGFLMSYLAVLGMAFLTRPLAHLAGEGMAAMLSMQILLVPYSIYTFNRFNPLSIAINIPVVLIASLLIPFTVTLFAAGTMMPLPDLLYDGAALLTRVLIRLNHILNMDGKTSYERVSPNRLLLLSILLCILLISSEWFRIRILRREYTKLCRCMLLLFIPLVALTFALRDPFADDELVFIDVGQGDAVHLRCVDQNLLIDGGGSMSYSVGEKCLEPYFLKNGIDHLDLAICTHLHMDHYKGIQELSEDFPISAIAVPEPYRGSAEAPESADFLKAGDRFEISKDAAIQVLWPLDPQNGGGDANRDIEAMDENELTGVYRIDYGGVRVLITGDLLEEGESDMLQYYAGTDALRCDVLKIAHHGSRSSSSEAFLDAADPDIAVISVGENNRYGHPSEETLNKLKERDIDTYRTDQNGAVGIDIHRNGITVDRMIEHVL